MEPHTTGDSFGKAVLLWVLSGLGVAALVFAILLAQIPGEDRTFGVTMFSIAGVLMVAAIVMVRLRAASSGGWRPWPIAAVILGGGLLTCVYGLISELTYRLK